MTRIYTRKGDRGDTSLLGGRRVAKDDPRVEAYGSVEEVCAFVGAARVEALEARFWDDASTAFVVEVLDRCQDALMRLCAQVASPDRRAPVEVADADVDEVERAIDRAQAEVEPLDRFVLPGETRLEASLHVARTVCRRAERRVVALRDGSLDAGARYLNRLSDLLFALARLAVKGQGRRDRVWERRDVVRGVTPSRRGSGGGGSAPTGNPPGPSRVPRARRLPRR